MPPLPEGLLRLELFEQYTNTIEIPNTVDSYNSNDGWIRKYPGRKYHTYSLF